MAALGARRTGNYPFGPQKKDFKIQPSIDEYRSVLTESTNST